MLYGALTVCNHSSDDLYFHKKILTMDFFIPTNLIYLTPTNMHEPFGKVHIRIAQSLYVPTKVVFPMLVIGKGRQEHHNIYSGIVGPVACARPIAQHSGHPINMSWVTTLWEGHPMGVSCLTPP